MKNQKTLKSSEINTPFGKILAISDEDRLYLLQFTEDKELKSKIQKLCKTTQSDIVTESSEPLRSISEELKEYFDGSSNQFKTPFHLLGTDFQKLCWMELTKIPFGQTLSYQQQATNINKPAAYRAVANANGANPLAIIVPCHRIIRNTGHLGGYSGGVHIKKHLLNLESNKSLF